MCFILLCFDVEESFNGLTDICRFVQENLPGDRSESFHEVLTLRGRTLEVEGFEVLTVLFVVHSKSDLYPHFEGACCAWIFKLAMNLSNELS